MVAGAGGRGGKQAREMYLIQFPGDEEDEGAMVEDEEGEGSLSGEGEESPNIKEEVREAGFLRGGGGGVGGESGTASLQCSTASCNQHRPKHNTQRESFACVCQPLNRCKDVVDKGKVLI